MPEIHSSQYETITFDEVPYTHYLVGDRIRRKPYGKISRGVIILKLQLAQTTQRDNYRKSASPQGRDHQSLLLLSLCKGKCCHSGDTEYLKFLSRWDKKVDLMRLLGYVNCRKSNLLESTSFSRTSRDVTRILPTGSYVARLPANERSCSLSPATLSFALRNRWKSLLVDRGSTRHQTVLCTTSKTRLVPEATLSQPSTTKMAK